MTCSPADESADRRARRAGGVRPWLVRGYYLANRGLEKAIVAARAIAVGFWLGVLSKESLDAVDQAYYEDVGIYCNPQYNRRGLWEWESAMLEQFFPKGGRVLVAGAGGGREMLALHHLGYAVDGTECNAELAAFANEFLRGEGAGCQVRVVPRDQGLEGPRDYDAIIVGWSAYMLVQGRARRVALLRSLRTRVAAGAPLLISFYVRRRNGPYFHLVRWLANLLRWPRRLELVELGDSLAPTFVHYFTEPEIAGELEAGGFRLEFFGARDYGHAVGRAI
jgi:hypothetical protein